MNANTQRCAVQQRKTARLHLITPIVGVITAITLLAGGRVRHVIAQVQPPIPDSTYVQADPRASDPMQTPTTCRENDAGFKGVNLTPYDPTVGVVAAIIRAGDERALDALKAADVRWVRLEFVHQNGRIDFAAYDYMIDKLCNAGINVLGLLDANSLSRKDYNDVVTSSAYQTEFAQLAGNLANHFQGRVSAWEVWNEPDDRVKAYMTPVRYAGLLRKTYNAIKGADTEARVVLGGMGSAWNDAYQYFTLVLSALGPVGTSQDTRRPFDAVGIHPYPNGTVGDPDPRDPDNYLTQFDAPHQPSDKTNIDRWVSAVDDYDPNAQSIPFWVTEFGWNSSKGNPARPTCLESVLVTEHEQADFLTRGFDVLLRDVKRTAIKKVFAFQFMDTGIEGVCDAKVYAWLYGIYRSDKVTPKPARCAFFQYGSGRLCPRVYVPLVERR